MRQEPLQKVETDPRITNCVFYHGRPNNWLVLSAFLGTTLELPCQREPGWEYHRRVGSQERGH